MLAIPSHVLRDSVGFCWVLLGSAVLLDFVVLLGFAGFFSVLPGSTVFYWVLLCSAGIGWALLGYDSLVCFDKKKTFIFAQPLHFLHGSKHLV